MKTRLCRRGAVRVLWTLWSPQPPANLKSGFLHGISWQIGHKVSPTFGATLVWPNENRRPVPNVRGKGKIAPESLTKSKNSVV